MDLFRDSIAGYALYYLSGRRLLPHPEDLEDFQPPACYCKGEKNDRLPSRSDGSPSTQAGGSSERASRKSRYSSEQNTVIEDVVGADAQEKGQAGRSLSEKGVPEFPLNRTVTTNPNSQEMDSEYDPNLVTWYGPDDPANPVNWSLLKKCVVTFGLCLLTFSVYIGSSIYAPGEPDFAQHFHTSPTVASLGLTLFVFGYGIGPMFLSALTEIPAVGRNPTYIVTLAIFVILQVPTITAVNVPGFMVLRFLAGFWGSPPLATAGASIADMFPPKTRAYAIGVWGAAAVCGPVLGPLIAGFSSSALGWRWALWPLLFLSGGTLLLLIFILPETSPHNILYRRKERLRRKTGNQELWTVGDKLMSSMTVGQVAMMTLIRPFQLMLTEPIVLALNTYIALVYAILYIWFEAFPLVFGGVYNFSPGLQGLAFMGIFVGALLSYAGYCVYTKIWLAPLFDVGEDGKMKMTPEDRLPPACFGCWLVPLCMFWFGWTATGSIHWIVPIIGSSFFGMGVFLLFQSALNYLPDAYPEYAASVLAGNDFFRSMVGGAFPLFARAMFQNLQRNGPKAFPVSWGCTLLGLLSIAMVPIPFVFYRFGKVIRYRSRFALHE